MPNPQIEISFLKQEIEALKGQLLHAQTVTSTFASNALTALNDGDIEEVEEILKSIAGEES